MDVPWPAPTEPWWTELSDGELFARLWHHMGDDPIDEPWMAALVKNRDDERVIKSINAILKEPTDDV